MTSKGKVILILVMPGLGKSYSIENTDFDLVDFDIGHLRKFLGITHDDADERWKQTKLLYPALYEILSITSKWHNVYLVNEPAFYKYVLNKSQKYVGYAVLAKDAEDWIQRIVKRDPNDEFAALMKARGHEWYPGWLNTADEYSQETIFLDDNYLSDVLGQLLSGIGKEEDYVKA